MDIVIGKIYKCGSAQCHFMKQYLIHIISFFLVVVKILFASGEGMQHDNLNLTIFFGPSLRIAVGTAHK